MDFQKHNAETKKLWEDYASRKNARVPLTIAFDEQFNLPMWGRTFRQYYEDVKTQIDVQLKSQKWMRESVLQDAEMGIPETWYLSPPCWMGENEFFGAEIKVQENDYSWGMPVDLPKAELIKKLRNINAEERVLSWKPFLQYKEMTKLVENMEFCGKPVKTVIPLAGTHGIFTKAAEVRGLAQICTDLHDDPAFAKDLLSIITDLTIQRIKALHKLTGSDRKFPQEGGWGLADDSVTLISGEQYIEFILPFHKKIYSEMGGYPRHIHLCGSVQHLFGIIYKELGVRIFNGPGVKIDFDRMIKDTGADIEIQCSVGYAATQKRGEIESVLRKLMKDSVKNTVKMMVYGYVVTNTPVENLRFMYDRAVQLGNIQR